MWLHKLVTTGYFYGNLLRKDKKVGAEGYSEDTWSLVHV